MAIPQRSFVIPVLDFSPHSPFNIRTLLADLENIPGEVICIFNNRLPYDELHDHPRINKYCFNNLNPGVSRSWNIGLQLAEGAAIFVLNADLHVERPAIDRLEQELFRLDRAVIAGPQGSYLDYRRLAAKHYFSKGKFDTPIQTDDVSGFFFALHAQRFRNHGLLFDVRFSPCLTEEWDMGLQIRRAGLACYVVPVTEFEHNWGTSHGRDDQLINYFCQKMRLKDIRTANREEFQKKWKGIYPELF